MNIFMIDGIGPFFRNIDRRRINWSKIPFRHLDRGGFPAPFKMEAALREFETLVARSSAAGFNAISIDDLAHIAMHPDYSKRLKERIAAYRSYYKRIFEIAAQADMRIYLTSDIIFDPPGYPHPLKSVSKEILPFLKELLEELFDSFPQTAGLIIRIGECDGVDVEGDFRSILSVRTPAQCRRILEGLLPLFEARRRNLVFRLWTVGAHPVGDLIWNKHTFDKAFGGLESDALILSLKYGESDFFRYLPINPLFFRSRHRKMLEWQARREYEGFGSYPSFTGWDYEA